MQHMKVYNGGTFLQLHLMHSVKMKYLKQRCTESRSPTLTSE